MFSAALRLATFLLVPAPSAVWFPTFTCRKQQRPVAEPSKTQQKLVAVLPKGPGDDFAKQDGKGVLCSQF